MTSRNQLISHGLRKRSCGKSGFTLPELLVAALIAAGIAAITAQVMINQLLEGRRLEVAQRYRENISRLNYLIQIESSEGQEFDLDNDPDDCDSGGDDNAFTIWVPRPTGQYADDLNRTGIQYYNDSDDEGDHVWRCGPPVTRNGVLSHGLDNQTGIVINNAQIDLDPLGCPVSTARSVTYRVTTPAGLAGANVGALGGCNTAHARSVFVCNPEDPDNPDQPGDC